LAGCLYTLGSFFNFTKVAQSFGLLFSRRTSFVLILTKNGFGYILGDFLTKSSGHTACRTNFQAWGAKERGTLSKFCSLKTKSIKNGNDVNGKLGCSERNC
jgi:hypothetical protein